jgi:hypothetical protein
MLFKEIIDVYIKNHIKSLENDNGITIVKIAGTYNYH